MTLLLAKVTFVFAAALAATAMLQNAKSSLRHLLLISALTIGLLLPFAQLLLPTWQLLPAAEQETASLVVARHADAAQPVDTSLSASTAAAIPTPGPSTPWQPARSIAWLPAIWAAGSFFFMLRLAGGVLLVERARRTSRPSTRGVDRALVRALSEKLGIRRPVTLCTQSRDSMPALWGYRQPAILLPAAAQAWSPGRRHDVVAHELAHVARGDVLFLLLAQVACAVYWFHPLAWQIQKTLRVESERAADDLALATGAPPKRYAEHLLSAAAEFNHHYSVAPVMAARTQLEQRIMAILNASTNRGAITRTTHFILFAVVALCLVGVSSIGRAQTDDMAVALSESLDATTVGVRSDSAAFAAHLKAIGVSPDDVDALLAGLTSGDSLTRGASAWALGDSEDPRVVEPLVQAGYDADPRVRQWALRSLSRWPVPEVAALQIDRLQDADAEVRQWAVRGLAAQPADTRAEPLIGALSDSDAEVRQWAVRGLDGTGDVRVTDRLLPMLGDPGAEVREWAVRGLAGIDDANVQAALAATLAGEAGADVSEWIIRSLPADSSASSDVLKTGLQSPHAEVRQWSVRGLDASADEQVNDLIIGMLGDSDAEVRQWSARGLGFCGNDRAVAPLQGLGTDSDEEVREWAEKSLAIIECRAQAKQGSGR